MQHNKKHIILFLLAFTAFSLFAQKTTMVTSNSKEFPGKTINIKWVSEGIMYSEGVNLYRKENNVPYWSKLNETPIMKGDYQAPDSAFTLDTNLQQYIDVAEGTDPALLVGMAKMFFLLEMVYSNEFAKFIGVQFDDNSVTAGNTYQYMVKRIKGDKEIFEGISEPIVAGAFVPEKAPEEVRTEAQNKKVNLWWKVEPERFHSINIYRYSNYDETPIKITPEPFVLSQRKGADGKMSYPDVYFTDKEVLNDTNYFYTIAGIDFFGRETDQSAPVMASPVNRRPPPPPVMENPEVNLFDIGLQWAPSDLSKVVGYNLYRSTSIYEEFERLNDGLLATPTIRFEDKVEKPGFYYYYVSSVDKNDNEGKSNMIMAEVIDIWPPPIPQNLKAESDSGTITLTWNSVEDEHLKGYRLYRTIDMSNKAYYTLMNAKPIEDTTFIDQLPFNARNKFFYTVVSLDTSLNMSDFSKPASAVLPDVTPPDAPFIKSVSTYDNALQIEWLPNFDVDLLGYHLYRENLVDSVPQLVKVNRNIIPVGKHSLVDLDVEEDITYHYYLKAIDSVGNLSIESNRYPGKLSLAPDAPEFSLRGINARPTPDGKEVNLSWQLANANAVKGVVIFRRSETDEHLKPVSGRITENEFTDNLPVTNQAYYYVLIAYSHNGDKWTSETITVQSIEE